MKKISEDIKINVVGASQTWFSMANYDKVAATAYLLAADDTETMTIQLRKATDAAGTNAANLGDAVVVTSSAAATDLVGIAEAYADDLGKTAGGLDFTHVSATTADTGDTETVSAPVLIRSGGRYGVAMP